MSEKVPVMWNNMYMGRNISEQQAELIMQTRGCEAIPNLKKMLYDIPLELIARSVDEQDSVRNILKREGKDINEYISELRDYQTVGTAFMYLSPRSIIADGCGLGKTAEISGLINWLKLKGELTRFLIAVEATALCQTQMELIRFTGLNVVTMPGDAKTIKKIIQRTDWNKVDGLVVKHSTLRSDPFSQWLALNLNSSTRLCKIFNTFFLDESSVIKNTTTKTSEYTKNICNIATRVHFMNATVFETNLSDIYNQLDMLNETLLPKKWRIEKEFCTFSRTSYWTKENGKAKMNFRHTLSGYKNQSVFKEALKLVYFGRSMKDVGKDLPNVYKIYEVEPTMKMMLTLNSKENNYRYNELLNCPSLIPDAGIPMTRKDVPKLDRLCTLVENEFSGESIMVYCFHKDAQSAIYNEMLAIGRKPVILNGDVTDDIERYKIQQGFNTGVYDVIITNIKKSINLYGGNVCIFYSLETNIAKMEQIRGRIDRHVDDSIKTFVLLLYTNTPEYKFFTDVVGKRAKDSRSLTIDAKTAADFFMDAVE